MGVEWRFGEKNSLKDPYIVLRQKEKDLERVRKEIKALLIAAALLAEDESADAMAKVELSELLARSELDELGVYYPFVARLRRPPKS